MDPVPMFRTALAELAFSPATGDPAGVIGVIAGVCAAAMIVLSVLSKKGKGGRR